MYGKMYASFINSVISVKYLYQTSAIFGGMYESIYY